MYSEHLISKFLKVFPTYIVEQLLLHVPSLLQKLAIIETILIFETAALNRLLLLQLYQARRFFSLQWLLPTKRFPAILPCIMFWSSWYISPLIMWPRYNNLWFLMFKITSLSFFIHLNTFDICHLFRPRHSQYSAV